MKIYTIKLCIVEMGNDVTKHYKVLNNMISLIQSCAYNDRFISQFCV